MKKVYWLDSKLLPAIIDINSKTIIKFMSHDFQYLFKFIVIGDTGVGKSCVVLQFVQQKMIETHDITIGVQFATRNMQIGKKTIKLQVWDTAGQQNFKSITRSYYRSAIGAFLVYDITKRKTFEHLQEWLKQIKNNGNAQMQILVIGNKNDLQSQRQVSAEEGRIFAESEGLKFIQLNARDYSKVESAFKQLTENILRRIQAGEVSENTPGVKFSQDVRINPIGALRESRVKKMCC